VGRVAGDSDHYELAIINGAGQPTGRSIYLPSVTTILKALPKFGLDWYGYKMGLLEGRRLATDPNATVWTTDPSDPSKKVPISDDAFYEKAKELGRAGQARTPTSELKAAGGRGTNVHDLAEEMAKSLLSTGKLPAKQSIPSDTTGYVAALKKFYDERIKDKLAVVHVEVPVVSLMNQYAGTLDVILLDEATGVFYIVDWKTSKDIYESHLLQITAYEHAAKEQEWIPRNAPTIGTVVRLGADGNYEMRNSDFELADFMSVYRVWQFLQATKAG
jgi:hypothetical protein